MPVDDCSRKTNSCNASTSPWCKRSRRVWLLLVYAVCSRIPTFLDGTITVDIESTYGLVKRVPQLVAELGAGSMS